MKEVLDEQRLMFIFDRILPSEQRILQFSTYDEGLM